MKRNNHKNVLTLIAIIFTMSVTFIACRKDAWISSSSDEAGIAKSVSVKPSNETPGQENSRFVGGIGWGRPTRQCDGHGICIIWDRTPDNPSTDTKQIASRFTGLDDDNVRIEFLQPVDGQPGEVIHGYDEPPVAFSPMVAQSLGSSELYLLPGEYPIKTDAQHPFGYVDVRVARQ